MYTSSRCKNENETVWSDNLDQQRFMQQDYEGSRYLLSPFTECTTELTKIKQSPSKRSYVRCYQEKMRTKISFRKKPVTQHPSVPWYEGSKTETYYHCIAGLLSLHQANTSEISINMVIWRKKLVTMAIFSIQGKSSSLRETWQAAALRIICLIDGDLVSPWRISHD